MQTLADMMTRTAQPGRVEWIGLRPEKLADMTTARAAEITEAGLVGDRARAGKRAVTLIQAEHLPAIGAYLGRGPIAPDILRRNLVVSGLNLSALRGRRVGVGTAVLEVTTVCAPCSRMEKALGHGGYAAMRGHGGWCTQVVQPGQVRIGDVVQPTD